jgi:hypothetical protein
MIAAPLALLALAACNQDDEFSGTLDTPTAVAVLDGAGPFTQPVGFAADGHGGRVRVLDLLRGTYLADDPEAGFFAGSGLATGGARLLSGLVAVAPADDQVHVIAADRKFNQLVVLPYVVGVEAGAPVEDSPTVAEATFIDADSSGESVEVRVQPPARGRAARETWTFRFKSGVWRAEGSRSGPQRRPCAPNAPWISDDRAVVITLVGIPTDGDQAIVRIEDRSTEIDLPATPESLSLSPDGQRLALTLGDDDGAGALWWVDRLTGALTTPAPLPADARPLRMAWAPDSSRLYAADANRGSVWEVDAAGAVTEHELPWPVFDVAVLDGADGRRLFVARADASEVWVYSLASGALIDTNAATPGVDGMAFLAPVRGLEAIHEPYRWPTTAAGPQRGRTVVVSLTDGQLVWMSEERGCLVADSLGPRTARTSQVNLDGDWRPGWDVNASTPGLTATEDARHHVIVNPCAGIARAETWRLRYDATVQAWKVTAAISGEQSAPLIEDARYLSDRAEVSLVMRSGTLPSVDGMAATFEVVDGVLTTDGSNQGTSNNNQLTFDLPGDPAVFYAPSWTDRHPYVLVPVQSSDIVVRVEPSTGLIDAVWD